MAAVFQRLVQSALQYGGSIRSLESSLMMIITETVRARVSRVG